ncbi:hypothetical protein K458DRAFT_442339 [Lentithecium fluviatile CBS 122367]|uniref:Uncharacterized protein n=1 Tax=Lentithecium fluviatile CBS 122367 TaxID=1168545 RepID=A0A6G1J4N7_9PLEO|nr:hypothetical protein K458DRAFT_442339 [Lentithecium fluviatile CBS 122367]
MPQYNAPAGTYAYPDAKSTFPAFHKVHFGRTVALGIGAGALGTLAADFYTRHIGLLNHVHHFGMDMLAGPVRAIMSYYRVIGPVATFLHTGVRIMIDQVMENSAIISAMPWAWPINEQVVDLVLKGVYGVVVGKFATGL